MKKQKLKILLAALIAVVMSFSMLSCSKSRAKTKAPTGSLETPTYLNGDSSDEAPTDKSTEEQTDKKDETPTQGSTEADTEPEPEPSLEYKSFGNGTCSVAGLGTSTDLYVVIPEKSPAGDIVTTIEPGAFKGNKDITVVQIPSTVFSIGELAFADCKSLVHIAVDEKNAHFCSIDGVLFDISLTRLMCYPSAKASTSLLLPSTLTKIDDMALYGCNSLKVIKFDGTVEQWAAISMGEKNYGVYTASLIFS